MPYLVPFLEASAIVLAADAPDEIRRGAYQAQQYIGPRVQLCDGIADNVEIQAAIDEGAKHILLGEGDFYCQNIQLASGITIEGLGEGTVLNAESSLDTHLFTNAAGASNITIRNLKIVMTTIKPALTAAGNYDAVYLTATDSLVENIHCVDVGYYGVDFWAGSEGSVARNCWIETPHDGGLLFDADACSALDNKITDWGWNSAGNNPQGFGIYIRSANRCKVIGNTLEGNGTDAAGYSDIGIGVSEYASLYTIIIGNIILDVWKAGILVSDGSHYAQIIGNYLNNTGRILTGQIRVSNSNYAEIVANIILSTLGHGAALRRTKYSKFSENIIVDSSQTANNTYDDIFVDDEGTTTESQYNTINSNICRATQTNKSRYGLRFDNADQDYNTALGNVFDGQVTDKVYNVAANNIVRSNVGYQTENSGAATVASGQTTIVVAHGLAATPTRILLTARLWSNAAKAWVTTIGSTNFTINVDADPGAGTAIFDWAARVGEG